LRKRFWEQTIPVETEVEEITYSCPECGETLFTVPLRQCIPEEKITITCSKGHKVKVPNYKE
jgi:hypothetical protein